MPRQRIVGDQRVRASFQGLEVGSEVSFEIYDKRCV